MRTTEALERNSLLLSQLPPLKAAIMAAACTERLLPAYRGFRAETGWDTLRAFEALLAQSWQLIAAAKRPEAGFEDRIMALTPQGHTFDSEYTTAAQDACICLNAAFGFLAGDMSSQSFLEYVFEALESLAPDAGNHTLILAGSPSELEFQQRIGNWSEMRREISAQAADLEQLAMTNISPTLIDEIRARAEGSALRLVTTA